MHSWHPQTFHNKEKVWLAEQKRDEDVRKTEEWRKEINEERRREEMERLQVEAGILPKRTPRLDWMYGGAVAQFAQQDREDYLLGRKRIDDALASDTLATNAVLHTSGMDPLSDREIATKIRNDPLFAIKQREKERYKEMSANPMLAREHVSSNLPFRAHTGLTRLRRTRESWKRRSVSEQKSSNKRRARAMWMQQTDTRHVQMRARTESVNAYIQLATYDVRKSHIRDTTRGLKDRNGGVLRQVTESRHARKVPQNIGGGEKRNRVLRCTEMITGARSNDAVWSP